MSFPDSFQAHVEPLDQIEHLAEEALFELWDEWADEPELPQQVAEWVLSQKQKAVRDGIVSPSLRSELVARARI